MTKLKEKQNIPKGWVSKPLGDLGVLIMGQSPSGSSYSNDEKGVPLLNGAVELKKDGIYVHQYTTEPTRMCSKEDLLFCIRATIGNLQRADREYCLGRGVAALSVDDAYSWEYIAQQLEVLFILMRHRSQGGVIKGLKKDEIAEFEILIPKSKKEQQKIAEVLGAVDEEIEKTKEAIKATEKLKKGLMQQLFTRGIGHTKFKQTELGEIPESWDFEPMSKVLSFQGGFAFKSKDASEEGVRWLKIANVSFGQTDWSSKNYLPMIFLEKRSDFLLKESDVVMAMTRPVLGDKIKAARLNHSDVPAMLNQRVGRFVFSDSVSSEYMYQLIFSSYFINQVKAKIRGSEPPNISSSQIESIVVPLPDRDEQEKIARILSAVDEKISVYKKLLAKQTELKKGLMQDLLSGVKRVRI